jgi:hypothetical protein
MPRCLPRQLFEIDLKGEPVRVLRVVNGTVEADGRQRQFHLGVPLVCNTLMKLSPGAMAAIRSATRKLCGCEARRSILEDES